MSPSLHVFFCFTPHSLSLSLSLSVSLSHSIPLLFLYPFFFILFLSSSYSIPLSLSLSLFHSLVQLTLLSILFYLSSMSLSLLSTWLRSSLSLSLPLSLYLSIYLFPFWPSFFYSFICLIQFLFPPHLFYSSFFGVPLTHFSSSPLSFSRPSLTLTTPSSTTSHLFWLTFSTLMFVNTSFWFQF